MKFFSFFGKRFVYYDLLLRSTNIIEKNRREILPLAYIDIKHIVNTNTHLQTLTQSGREEAKFKRKRDVEENKTCPTKEQRSRANPLNKR